MTAKNVERDPETLALFIEESVEGLQRVEKLLLDAEDGHAATDMLAVMFRDFHTIKGTSAFLALDKVRDLAHAAEDLMSRLRDKTILAGPRHFATFMVVVNLLRRLIENVKTANDEGDIDVNPTVRELNAHMAEEPEAEKPAPAVKPAPAAAVAAPPAPAPATPVATPAAATPAVPAVPAEAHADKQPEAKAADAHKGEVTDGTVRVNVGVLDRLMNLIGELVLARNQMVQFSRSGKESAAGAQAYQRLNLVTSELQEQVMKTRMQPVARVFEKIPRMVRDLCQATAKQAVTQIDGTATEIDRALVEAIRDPVMHIVRNALDHGIETPEVRVAAGKSAVGRLQVRASHEGGMVLIEIEDDGKGMDPVGLRAHAVKKGVITQDEADKLTDREALDLVFRPGFSTAAKVAEISGRGVGMDVVRTHVERAGGQVELDSTPGRGCVVRMRMPLTLAIIPALLVRTGNQRFAIPQVNLLELVHLTEENAKRSIENVRGAPIYRLRGDILPLVRLSSVLRLPKSESGEVSIVVVSAGGRRYGLLVDQIHDTEEIVVKPLHSQLKRITCYAGATVLGDGGVALILEVTGIASMAGIDLVAGNKAADEVEARGAADNTQKCLIFEAGDGAPCAVPLAMVARLETVASKTIERVAGREVVQYRGHIMPIIRPESVLPLGSPMSHEQADDQPVIVFDFGAPVGMAVSRILDVTDVPPADDADQGRVPYTFGQTVVFNRTTVLVDVYRMMRDLAPDFVRERRRQARRPSILISEESNAMRAALSGFLRGQGFDVVDVNGTDSALRELRTERGAHFAAVVASTDSGDKRLVNALEAMVRERPQVPVFLWSLEAPDEAAELVAKSGARASINKLRREDLIEQFHHNGVLQVRRADDRRNA